MNDAQRKRSERNLVAFGNWMGARERRGWTPILPEHPESHWIDAFIAAW